MPLVGMLTMNSMSREYLNRIKDRVALTSSVGRLSAWLESHTTIFSKPYSFVGHEFQKEIIDCKHPNAVIIKPSQVGLSEMSARLVLGFLAVESNSVAIYTLPTVHEALRFAKSRIDPVIEGSKYLSSVMGSGGDSASFKQIGSSQLFMAGTHGKSLISIPTDLLITDELDFSSAEAVATAESRLSHSRFIYPELQLRGIRRKFSTPTVSGIGVSALYNQSDRKKRLVKCQHCAEWFWPNFLFNVVVDGFDRAMDELTLSDVQDLDERGLLSTARLICPSCHNTITQDNLRPQHREWVAEFPSVRHLSGFQVSPFDLPDYHSPESIMRKRLEFGEHEGHFRNFTLGIPYDSSTNSIEPTAVARNTSINPVFPESANIGGCVAGLDIGRTSWLTIGKKVGNEIHVLWAEQIRVGTGESEDNLFNLVVKRFRQFRVIKAVIDSQPFFDTVLRIQAQFPELLVLPCMYTLRDTKLPAYVVNENEQQVNANRTKVLDLFVKRVNTNKFKFAQLPEMTLVAQHLQGMKRVEGVNPAGLLTENWIRSSADHYFHALSYLNMASTMVESGDYSNFAPLPSIKECFVGKQYNAIEERNGNRY